MDVVEAIQTRKSIRGFRQDPVSKKVLEEILEVACRAPSTMNTQPWEFFVLAGEKLREVVRENAENFRRGLLPEPDHIIVGWPRDSVYRQRQVELAKQLLGLMGIPREDKEKRWEWMERGFRFFDAPAAVILVADRSLTEAGPLLDIGAVMQNICLTAWKYGLGTCVEDQGVLYPKALRRVAAIPESKRIIIAIAMGYPDWEYPANRVESTREQASRITTWVGFDEASEDPPAL